MGIEENLKEALEQSEISYRYWCGNIGGKEFEELDRYQLDRSFTDLLYWLYVAEKVNK